MCRVLLLWIVRCIACSWFCGHDDEEGLLWTRAARFDCQHDAFCTCGYSAPMIMSIADIVYSLPRSISSCEFSVDLIILHATHQLIGSPGLLALLAMLWFHTLLRVQFLSSEDWFLLLVPYLVLLCRSSPWAACGFMTTGANPGQRHGTSGLAGVFSSLPRVGS